MCVEIYHECWQNRCKVLHHLENQKNVMINETCRIKEDLNGVTISNLFSFVASHLIKKRVVPVE